MRSKKITELTEMTTAPAADDLMVIYDVSAGETKKVKPGLFSGSGYTRLPITSGVIDDLNTVFGFAQEPSAININGAIFGPGEGQYDWSWDSNTMTATLAYALGTGSFIHGVL